ncbi:MAG: hypothetical protein A2020_10500 [Lentisphaerae bacterium GWF2_45_14]|nr:MAG: hypothetical protein A2020_10500 [Lentisphaerae bacterium GWF2_45_14]
MKETACHRIEKALRKRVLSLRHDTKISTEMELCEEFSVSRMTMNKVIGKLVQDDLLYRVKKRGTFVKERRKIERPIYFLLPTIDYLTYDSALSTKGALWGLNAEASLSNRKVEILPVTRTNQINDYDWETLERISCGDDVFITSFWYKRLFPFLEEKECDVVCMDNAVWLEDEYRKILSNWYSIKLERKAGTETAIKYLADTGRKKPLLLYSYKEKEHPVTEGFKSGLKKAGLPFLEKLFVHVSDIKKTCSGLKELHKKTLFDSIVISTADMVKDICGELDKMKLRIPDDISVICLEEAPLLRDMEVPVSSMASPFSEVGREATRMFERDIFLRGETRLQQFLTERESTRKGAGSAFDSEYLQEAKVSEALIRFGTDGI